MQFTELDIPGVVRIDLNRIEDERGFLARAFCRQELSAHGLEPHIAQINSTLTRAVGTIRGFHFQRPPRAETKIVRCLRGAILDIAVDLRAGSVTYGQSCRVELNDQNKSMMYIPRGFGHGFQTLSPDTELMYFHSESYSKADEGGLNALDPALSIDWPLPVSEMSDRDRHLPYLSELEAIQL